VEHPCSQNFEGDVPGGEDHRRQHKEVRPRIVVCQQGERNERHRRGDSGNGEQTQSRIADKHVRNPSNGPHLIYTTTAGSIPRELYGTGWNLVVIAVSADPNAESLRGSVWPKRNDQIPFRRHQPDTDVDA
jgi:hypothetical protein